MKVVISHRFEDMVKKFSVEYIAGGSTQNSMRLAQVRNLVWFDNDVEATWSLSGHMTRKSGNRVGGLACELRERVHWTR